MYLVFRLKTLRSVGQHSKSSAKIGDIHVGNKLKRYAVCTYIHNTLRNNQKVDPPIYPVDTTLFGQFINIHIKSKLDPLYYQNK